MIQNIDNRSNRASQGKRRFEHLCMVAAGLAFIWFICSILKQQKEYAEGRICGQNMKRMSFALIQYTDDWDGHFPPVDRWRDSIDNKKYFGTEDRNSVFHCPAAAGDYGYAMNDALSGLSISDVNFSPRDTVLLFETDLIGRNAHGGVRNLVARRHYMLNCSFADGRPATLNPYTRSHWQWSLPGRH